MTCGSVQRRAARRRKSHRAGFSSQRRGVVHGCTEQLDLQPSQRDAAELLYYLHSGFAHAALSRDARGAPPASAPRADLLCDRRGDRPTHHGVAQPERGGARGAAARGVGATPPSTRHCRHRRAPPAGAPPDARGRCRHHRARADAELRQVAREDPSRRGAAGAAQAQAAAQAERLGSLRHVASRAARRAAARAVRRSSRRRAAERRASLGCARVLAAAVAEGATAGGRRQRPELKRLEPVPGVQTWNDRGPPNCARACRTTRWTTTARPKERRRGSRMRPSESAPALGRFRAPS